VLGPRIYGEEDDELESVIVRLLTERKTTLALAESCTGGCIANRLTNVPGASAVLLAGLVTYSNEAKQRFLGVLSDTLAKHGAVSEPVAREMAEGARREARADYALSVTGIAGPSGGTPEKPVGTVFIGLAGPSGTIIERNFNPYDRETFKQVTTQQALDLLRRAVSQRFGLSGT
jgi:PncC family amidohydrolase